MYGCTAVSPVTILDMTSPEPAHEPDRAPTTTNASALVLKCAVAIVLGLLIAGVALAYAGWKPEGIAGLLTAVGTIAGGLLVVLPRLVNVEYKVDQVARQTNGELRKHVTDTMRVELRAALAEQFGEPVAPTRRPPNARKSSR
jgi:hypothetical protein